jgi:hypothetical protein
LRTLRCEEWLKRHDRWERQVAWWSWCIVETWHERFIFELLREEVEVADV